MPPNPRPDTIPLDRYTGMARQFERTGNGHVFRRDGSGPAIPVSAEERRGFLRAGRWSAALHCAALLLVLAAALLGAEHLLPAAPGVARAAFVGLVTAGVGLLLYRSHGWYADAPARALAGRPAVGPAIDVDVTRWPTYRAIAGGTVVVMLGIVLHHRTTAASSVGLGVAAAVVGLAVAAMKWWFERGFTPRQQQAAIARRRAERAASPGRRLSTGRILLLILFLLVEGVLMLGAFLTVMVGIVGASGTNMDDPAPLPFIGGMILGFVAAGLVMWPLERLCRRWTGTTVADEFGFLWA
ncbi:hypothetical protein [Sphingomonas sp. VNH70]|uniref:hypothetical protein n=1 Tax=Sphingomonas silueang TaxID=3156617 RepID=UPI0032B4C2BD